MSEVSFMINDMNKSTLGSVSLVKSATCALTSMFVVSSIFTWLVEAVNVALDDEFEFAVLVVPLLVFVVDGVALFV